jgi:hypothetical protein
MRDLRGRTLINVIITLRMTKAEVERDIMPNLTPPPGGYFYWWETMLIVKFPLEDGEWAEAPCMLGKENMIVEVVDEKDLYKLPPADDSCKCPFCTGKLEDYTREILDHLDPDK